MKRNYDIVSWCISGYDSYMKIQGDYLLEISMKLNSQSYTLIMLHIISIMKYNNNDYFSRKENIVTIDRKDMINRLNVSLPTVKKGILTLIKLDFMMPTGKRGKYMINPCVANTINDKKSDKTDLMDKYVEYRSKYIEKQEIKKEKAIQKQNHKENVIE